MRSGDAAATTSSDVIQDMVGRLWQMKLKSITVLEKWMAKTSDFEIKTGLKAQLADERRHLRLIGEELKRLGGSLDAGLNDQLLSKPFAIVLAQATDVYRMYAFYRGVKASTLTRCERLIPMVDQRLGRLLQQLAMEDERHIRWAEMRLERHASFDEVRQSRVLVERVKASLEQIWSRPWLKLSQLARWNRPRYAG